MVEVDAARLVRLTRFAATEPYWGRARRYRFDDPAGVYGVTYGAEWLDVPFAETVLHEQGAFVDGRWVVDQARIDERFIARFMHPGGKRLRLADLTGSALQRLGLNNDLCTCDDYAAFIQGSAAVPAQVPEADGIGLGQPPAQQQLAVALFERSGVTCEPLPVALAARPEFTALLDRFGVELLPSTACPEEHCQRPQADQALADLGHWASVANAAAACSK